jgi:lipopolysaccharide export system permease protein
LLSIADRYILRQVAKPLAAAMAVGLLVLLAERMVRLLDTTLGKKNSFAVVFELLAYLVPHYLGLAIPAALFLGMLFGFSKLSRDNELDGLTAAGIGLHRLTRPVLLLGVFITFLSLLTIGWAQPYTRYAYRSVEYDIKNVDVFYLAEEGVFMQAGTRTFIIDQLDRAKNGFDRIFLFDLKDTGAAETVTATRGTLIEVPGERRPVLRLENGHRLTLEHWPDPAASTPPPPATVGNFATADTPLGKVSHKVFRPRGADERELTLLELIKLQDTPPSDSDLDEMRAELHNRLVDIATPLMLPFLAIPFALTRNRSQRAYRFGVALIILVAFNEIIEQGGVATKSHGISPWLSMWLPFGLLTAFALWRYYSTCFVLAPERLDPMLDRLAEALHDLRRAIARRLGWSAQT